MGDAVTPKAGVKKRRKSKKAKIQGITTFLYVTTQITAIIWISISYLIAIYATVKLNQPFPVAELSGQAMITIVGNSGLKTVANIFEHNNGGIFGTADNNKNDSKPTI